MIIEKNKVVSVNYLLTKKGTDEVIEETSKEQPFVFLYGVGGLLEDFESNLANKAVGDTFDFAVDHERGYGKRDEQFVTEVPVEAFLDEQGNMDTENVVIGKTLPMVDNEGQQLLGTVVGVEEKSVRMDFNHPLAGQDLNFKGEVLEIRDATAEELEHGHVHGPGGHEH